MKKPPPAIAISARSGGFGNYGVNFFGHRIDSGSPNAERVTAIFRSVASSLNTEIQRGDSYLFADCGLAGFHNGQEIIGTLSDSLRDGNAPHVVSVANLDSTLFLPERALEMVPLLLAQNWDQSDLWNRKRGPAWLDAYFDDFSKYLIGLVKGVFRDRNGVSVPFPLSIAQLLSDAKKPTQLVADITSPQVAGQLLYAVTEFFGDELFGVPYNLLSGLTSADYTCAVAGVITLQLEDFKIPGGDGTDWTTLVGTLIAFAAKTTESSVRSAMGAIVRGASAAAINNEVLAEVVTTLFSVLAKKTAEAFAYGVLEKFIKEDTTIPAPEKVAILNQLNELFLK